MKNETAIELEPVRFELVKNGFFIGRFACHACGGMTDKALVSCEVTDGEWKGFRVCERCLERGAIDETMEKRARTLEAQAADLRELKGRLVLPTFDQWEAAENEACREMEQDMTEGQDQRPDPVPAWAK